MDLVAGVRTACDPFVYRYEYISILRCPSYEFDLYVRVVVRIVQRLYQFLCYFSMCFLCIEYVIEWLRYG